MTISRLSFFLKVSSIFLCLSFSFIQRSYADVIAIIACDTLAYSIDRAVNNDLNNMREEAQRIAFYTKQNLRELIFDGHQLNSNYFLDTLNSLTFTEHDIVIFYFSGHGYRTHSKGDSVPWPNLFFSISNCGVDYALVLEILASKNQRFLLAIADCCNNFLEEDVAPPVISKKLSTKAESSRIAINYKKLFLETEGKILITSSDVSELSWCMMRGALFTLAFLDNIHEETLKRKSPSWESILQNSSKKILKHQTPIYQIISK